MILTLFAILTGIALILMIFGFIANIAVFSIGGAALFMVLGGLILGGEGLQYKIGVNTSEIYVYGNNFDEYHWDGYNTTAPLQTDKNAYLFHTEANEQDLYGEYDDSTTANYGWILLLLGMAAMAYSLFTIGD